MITFLCTSGSLCLPRVLLHELTCECHLLSSLTEANTQPNSAAHSIRVKADAMPSHLPPIESQVLLGGGRDEGSSGSAGLLAPAARMDSPADAEGGMSQYAAQLQGGDSMRPSE